MRRHIPNLLTFGNVTAGFAAIIAVAQWGNVTAACLFIGLGVLFDVTDGLAARLLQAYSPLGAHLDSFADAIAFGVAPAVLASTVIGGPIGAVCGAAVTAAAVYRLARFNVVSKADGYDPTWLLGCPSPVAAGLIVAAVAPTAITGSSYPIAAALCCAAASLLMVSHFRYIHHARWAFAHPLPAVAFMSVTVATTVMWPWSFLIIWSVVVGQPVATQLVRRRQ